jgi:hypothetical protein
MQHLTEEQLVLHHYRDGDGSPDAVAHLRACGACSAEYATLRRVLDLVSEAPVPERGDEYGEAVWNRLRWRLGRRRRRTWELIASIAAVLAIAFVGGRWWEARQHHDAPVPAASTAQPAAAQQPAANGERLLVLVVGDHLETSERVLTELVNADPQKGLDVARQQERVQDLVLSNRIYRQTASERGDARIASILSDLEPVLIELSNSPSTLTPEAVRALQRRIDSQGLLFKVRLISAQTRGGDKPAAPAGNSL